MLVHVDPLCINKMRILNFPRLPDGFANFGGWGGLTLSCTPSRRIEEMETKILIRRMGSDRKVKLQGSIYQVNGCSGSESAPAPLSAP